MKHYTHGWLAMMAMKRIEFAKVPESKKDDAKALITWFKNYRDLVLQGAWYPDTVFKDMSGSHIAKYYPVAAFKSSQNGGGIDSELVDEVGDIDSEESNPKIKIWEEFKKMPKTLLMYKERKKSDKLGQPYIQFKRHNLCDRCESFTESLIDSFKILTSENVGSPVVPNNNHIAMRFFILSHYIADGHMPLHCDARPLKDVHTFIEQQWEDQIENSYEIDGDNDRFFYEADGYPRLSQLPTPLVQYVEEELRKRQFVWGWGDDNNNTWDYMSGITQYSYLMAYRLVPDDHDPKDITSAMYQESEVFKEHFEEYSRIILGDAVESIAKIWLHAWCRYREWFRGQELAFLNAEKEAAKKEYDNAYQRFKRAEDKKNKQEKKVKEAETDHETKQNAYNEALAGGRKTDAKLKAFETAKENLAKEKETLKEVEMDYKNALKERDDYKALADAAAIAAKRKDDEIKKYGNSTTI